MKWKVEKIPEPDFLTPLDISCVRIPKCQFNEQMLNRLVKTNTPDTSIQLGEFI